jgi:hypothetical protein
MYHGKVEVGIKIGEAIYCASLSLTFCDIELYLQNGGVGMRGVILILL